MQQFYLFLDTETSGLPKSWTLPYDHEKNWPHIIQFAWIVCDKNFKEVKRENHYIKNDGFKIDKSAKKIHQITEDYLEIHGVNRNEVLILFLNDIKKFNPLIVGHFIEFDYHMLNVEFMRMGQFSPFDELSFFCTMMVSTPFVKNPTVKHLKLNDFYETLFGEKPLAAHNALADALNTAEVFFQLLKTKQINSHTILSQQHQFKLKNRQTYNTWSKTKQFFNRLFSLKSNG